ncbi:MAG TPA: c-type cytochrome domain-containing protein [Rhodothermales bacterium]|nr:c-type cytochrome domain-containing protein [Rhodothermales bacterium]
MDSRPPASRLDNAHEDGKRPPRGGTGLSSRRLPFAVLRAKLRTLWAPAAVIVLLLLLLLLALGVDSDNPSDLTLFTGRLHPLIVHLPIGFILLAGALEYLSRKPALARIAPAVPLVLCLGAASAVGAVFAGYLLGVSGGYSGDTFAWHERTGIAVAVLTAAACGLWFARRNWPSRLVQRTYSGTVSACVLLVAVAGHLGGTLTHGEGYLTEYMPRPIRFALAILPGQSAEERAFGSPSDARVYRDVVRPILESRCVSCHGPDKQKGGLRLDQPDSIAKGGEDGAVIVPGRGADSDLIRRIWLPEEDKDHMPPKGRRQVSVAEAEVLRWWIDQGASFDTLVADVKVTPAVQPLLEQRIGPLGAGLPAILKVEVAAARPEDVEKARALGFSVEPLSDGTAFLQVHSINAAPRIGTEQVRALLPLAQQITWLDLSDTQIDDDALAVLARFPNLSRLHLDRTAITDAGLANLGRLEHIEYLNLYGTQVTDAGLRQLASLTNLRSLYVWQTGATANGVAQLKGSLPRLQANLGLDADSVSVPSGNAAASVPASATTR